METSMDPSKILRGILRGIAGMGKYRKGLIPIPKFTRAIPFNTELSIF